MFLENWDLFGNLLGGPGGSQITLGMPFWEPCWGFGALGSGYGWGDPKTSPPKCEVPSISFSPRMKFPQFAD